MLLPATPGWVSLPVVVGGPRHSWLGSVGGGGLWCVVCGVWCVGGVPRHSWRRFRCATPRHSWLGLAAGGGGRSPPLLAGVRWRRWCVVCGVWRWCVGGVVAGRALVHPDGGWCACVFVCVLCLAESGGPASRARSGAPHLFLWPLCLSAVLGPLRAGVARLSFAAVVVPRWLFFSASRLAVGCSLVVAPPPPSPFVSRGFRRSCLVPWCFFFSFFFFLCSPPLSPAFSGFRPRVPWASALALFALLAFRFSALRALVPLSCLPPGCWLLPRGGCPPPPLFVSRGFRSCRSVLFAVLCCASLGAVLRRAAARCVARCCAVVCCGALV